MGICVITQDKKARKLTKKRVCVSAAGHGKMCDANGCGSSGRFSARSASWKSYRLLSRRAGGHTKGAGVDTVCHVCICNKFSLS